MPQATEKRVDREVLRLLDQISGLLAEVRQRVCEDEQSVVAADDKDSGADD